MDLANGMLIQHASLGLGKVIALEDDAVHVFFEKSAKRFATKLRLPTAAPFLSPAQTKSPWLKGISSFSRDSKTGRYGLAETWLTLDEAVARFTRAFPKGFADPKFTGGGKEKGERAQKWRAAHDAFAETLGSGEGERLLADDRTDEITRRVLRVERHITSLHPTADKTSLKDALRGQTASRDFFAATFELLAASAPDQQRSFEKLASAAAALPQVGPPGSSWPVVTVLPFIAQPERHVFLRPKSTCEIAQRLGFDVSYDPAPNWPTYSALLRFSRLLLDTLKPLGARDQIDVESFLCVTAAKRAGV